MQRLDKFIVGLGFGTRTEIKKYAKNGKITVNGEIVRKTDVKIDENTDVITFCGEVLEYKTNTYLMLNKKAGYVTANIDNMHETVMDLIEEKYKNLFAVGRLDKDTEGLLILTDDGKLSHGLMSPKKHVSKTYYAEVSGEILEKHIEIFENGIEFKDGTKLKPAELEIIDKNKAFVTIYEGKFHQVKNMFRVIDCTVTYLKRTKIGELELDENLALGEYRKLSKEEEKYLKEKVGM